MRTRIFWFLAGAAFVLCVLSALAPCILIGAVVYMAALTTPDALLNKPLL